MHVEPLERGAGLAVVDEGAPEQALGDLFGIGVRQDDAGIVAAKLQRQPLQGSAALAITFLPVRTEAGEGDLPMPGCAEIAAPKASGPVMQLTTPGGSTSFMISTMRKVDNGV